MNIDEIRKIGVVGAGIMGSGIAEVCARAGYTVLLYDISEFYLNKGMEKLRTSLSRGVQKGKLTQEEADLATSRIKGVLSLDELSDADVIIEAAPENMETKKKLYKELDGKCKPQTIFASNTSSLMITDLSSATKRPEKFIGMHWFNPAPVMKLIELIRAALTSDETFNLIKELSIKLGKTPVDANDGPGFFTSRFITAMMLEAIRLLESGIAGVKEIDTMCKLGFNHPIGALELADLVGLDTLLHIAEYCYEVTKQPHYAPPLILRKMVASGFLGDPKLKVGSKGGFYEYFNISRS